MKFFDTTPSTAASFNGTITDLTAIPQGVGVGQRIADEITVHGIDFRHVCDALPAVGGAGDIVRMIVVRSLADTAVAAATLALFLQDLGSAGAPSSRWNFVSQQQELFEVLHDELKVVGSQTSPLTSDSGHRQIRINRKVRFNPAATTGVGKIFFLLVGNTAAAGATIFSTFRVLYTDENA